MRHHDVGEHKLKSPLSSPKIRPFPLVLFFILIFTAPLQNRLIDVSYASDEAIIRAKIGIRVQSKNKIFRSKSRERLRSGDLIRLYVHPEKGSYVYIIHDDGKVVNLLNVTQQEVQSSTLILPSAQAYFEFDGKSSMERITIICAPRKMEALQGLMDNAMPLADWRALEANLTEESKLLIADEAHQGFAIAGNVRGLNGVVKSDNPGISAAADNDAFLKELQIFSGKGLLIKTYAFKIKK